MNLVRILLYPLACLYGLIMLLRNCLFDLNILSSEQFKIPVISVGNLSVGGSGKTPHVEYLIRLLQAKGYKVGTLSRGYKRKTKGFLRADENSTYTDIGDEPLQYKQKFTDLEVGVDEKRAHGIKIMANTSPHIDAIILDDAFQHRSVKPGLSILLTDFHNLYKQDYPLPTGNLREPRRCARRADLIIVTKTPTVFSPLTRRRLFDVIKPKGWQQLYFSYIKYQKLVPVTGIENKKPPKDFNIVLLFCGIANSYPLQEHLKTLCSELVVLEFPDHHKYTKKDLEKIIWTFNEIFTTKKLMITTEKDAMRLIKTDLIDQLKQYPLFYIPIEVGFHNQDALGFDKIVVDYVTENKRDKDISEEQDTD